MGNGKKIIFGEIGKLKREKIEEYKLLHADPWPKVTEMITKCNLRNYSIFIQNDIVFAYYEYVGDDFEKDMQMMEADPVTQDWWKHTKPCFEKYAISSESEFYHGMQQIFYLK